MTEEETAKEVFTIRTDDRGAVWLTRNGADWSLPSKPTVQFWDQLQEARKELEELKAAIRDATGSSEKAEGLRTTLGRAILAKNELRAKLDAAESELGDVAAENGRLREENAAYEKKLETLRQFLCEPGKNRPLSMGYEVGSVIRYIEDLEEDLKSQTRRLKQESEPNGDSANSSQAGPFESLTEDFRKQFQEFLNSGPRVIFSQPSPLLEPQKAKNVLFVNLGGLQKILKMSGVPFRADCPNPGEMLEIRLVNTGD